VLDEARFLHRHDPSLSGALLLTMATLFGAWALRIDATAGSLRVGKAADLAVVALPGREEPDPHALLFESDRAVVATLFQGELVSGSWNPV
jgi:cytosine/adenosine deaminase-related metal-dependent hydrolase